MPIIAILGLILVFCFPVLGWIIAIPYIIGTAYYVLGAIIATTPASKRFDEIEEERKRIWSIIASGQPCFEWKHWEWKYGGEISRALSGNHNHKPVGPEPYRTKEGFDAWYDKRKEEEAKQEAEKAEKQRIEKQKREHVTNYQFQKSDKLKRDNIKQADNGTFSVIMIMLPLAAILIMAAKMFV